jgi:SAM-dependent methyltransferase
MWNWQRLARLLRRSGLIKLGYYVLFTLDFLYRQPANRRYARAHPEVAIPPAIRRFETNYDTNLERFVEDGRKQAHAFYHLVKPLLPDSSMLTVCEWGCGVARLIRHMPTIDPPREIRAWGTDYSPALIDWCRENIPGIHFSVNGLEPPLPLEAGQFDWIYNSSVLTHLSPELQEAWIAENLRVLKPGGIALFTVHGDAYKSRLIDDEPAEYERKGVVVRSGTGAGEPWFTIYNNPQFVPTTLLRGREIVGRQLYRAGESPPRQDIWLVRAAGSSE